MPDNIQRNRGRPNTYKFDRGGQPAEFGPFIGTVKNNIDPTRSGRLQVYIEQFAGDNPDDQTLWRTVSYIPPFYGVTPRNDKSGSSGPGSYEGNQQSYGMWFTPPDLGVQVICFFVAGDPNQGYYLGCVPDPGVTHMIPAIGASRKFATQNADQKTQTDFANAKQLPVVEINQENPAIAENPRFFDQTKPVHSYLFSIFSNQGLLADYIRGPISSSAQRESPSSVFGVSTPGRPIYQGGLSEADIKKKLDSGQVQPQDIRVEGRRGGHSIVLDDGDLRGRDNLIRIRTAKGHQITMSDEADCFYFIHANGQSWVEMGSEGTVDVYSTNSVNIRSQGEINLHADQNININAGESLNIRAKNTHIESQDTLKITGINDFLMYSKTRVGIRSDGAINLDSARAGWRSSGAMALRGSRIDFNGPTPDAVTPPKPIVDFKLDDTKFVPGKGWQIERAKLETIVTRAPTHEPYPYHNRGVPVEINITAPPAPPPPPPVRQALATTASVPVASPATNLATTATAAAPNISTAAAGAVSAAQSAAQTAQGVATSAAPNLQNQITSAAAQASTLANQAQSQATAAVNQAVGAAGSAVGINAASVLTTPAVSTAIGSLDKGQVTGLVAQAKTAVGQASNVVSVDKGIGEFGMRAEQLEASGLIKPGTVNQLQNIDVGAPTAADIAEAARINAGGGDITPEQVARNRKTNEFLSSPFAWTGKDGAAGITDFLNNPQLQSNTQQNLMNQGLAGLQAAGLATGNEAAKDLGALVQGAAKFGVGAVESFVKGVAPPDVKGLIAGTLKSAQFATDFVTNKIGGLTGLTRSAAAVTNTVDRSVVDNAVSGALSNPKIPAPQFKPQPREEDRPSDNEPIRQAFYDQAANVEAFFEISNKTFREILDKAQKLQAQGNVTSAEVEALDGELQPARAFYNENREMIYAPIKAALRTAPIELRPEFEAFADSLSNRIKILVGISATIKEIIAELRLRVAPSQ